MIYVYSSSIYLLLLGLCLCSGVVSKDNSYTKAIKREIRGTHFESGGLECDASCLDKNFRSIAEYTKLYLFLKDNKKNFSEIIHGNLSSFKVSGFDVNKKTKILVHGWMEYAFDGFATDLRDSYFAASKDRNVLSIDWSEVPDLPSVSAYFTATEDVNVLSVDWSLYADLLYPLARLYVVPVGKFMAKFVDWLVLEAGVSLDSMHLIGLSLGAQVAGTIGEHVTSGSIGRITGLDPAGPGFSSSTSGRLDASDAQFVDVIHTCGHWAGYFSPCGDIDFYPNRGMYDQPGCDVDLGVCSHKRSYHLFNESISSEGFVGWQCDGWSSFVDGKCDDNTVAVMGEHVNTGAKGTFYLHTAGSYPFALGSGDTLQDDNEELSERIVH